VLALLNSELYSDDFLILLRTILLEGDRLCFCNSVYQLSCFIWNYTWGV